MQMATVRLQMAGGHEIYFRAPSTEIHRLLVRRHGTNPEPGEDHIINTEKNIPITVPWREIEKIHIF